MGMIQKPRLKASAELRISLLYLRRCINHSSHGIAHNNAYAVWLHRIHIYQSSWDPTNMLFVITIAHPYKRQAGDM